MLKKKDAYDFNKTYIEAAVEVKLIVELRNRFIAVSDDDGSIEMIFTAMHFNVSPLSRDDLMFMVVQIHDIQKEEINMLKFLMIFSDNNTANRFYKYVKDLPSVTDNLITVVVPSRIIYLNNGLVVGSST